MKPISYVVVLLAICAALWAQNQAPVRVNDRLEQDLNLQLMPSQYSEGLPVFSALENGKKLLLLKFGFTGAAGVKLQLDSFHLPPGASVFFRGEDGSQRFGPFQYAGPTGLGEFQSPPVAGDSMYLEFQVTGNVPALLPFHVARVSPVTGDELARFAAPPPPAIGGDSEERTSLYHGVPLTHQVKGGLALYEGDILLGNASDLPPARPYERGKGGMRQDSFGIAGYPAVLWPGGVVPYSIDSSIVSPSTVLAAAAMWNTTTRPTITVVPRTTEGNYVNFVRGSISGVCSSWIGMVGGAQTIYVGDSCGAGDLAHEIGHAVGLLHEHDRLDRDTYVTINWDNVNATYHSNFTIATYGTDLGAFDYNSIMGYPAWAFSSNGQPTITTIPAGIPIGQRAGLSAGDIAGAKYLYGAISPPPNVTVTLATNVASLSLNVGGVSYAAPKTVTAAAGTVYAISATSPQGSGPVRYAFANWSSGSSQSFTLTVPTSPVTLTSNFSTQYLVTATAGAGGAVTLSPSASGGFYASNSAVKFTATPSSGYCFANWTGLNSGAPAVTSLTVTAPVAATANFTRCGGNCASLPTPSEYVGPAGGTFAVPVAASAGCPWTVSASTSWISFPSGSSGMGPGTLQFKVAQNQTGLFRIGFVALGSDSLIVLQSN